MKTYPSIVTALSHRLIKSLFVLLLFNVNFLTAQQNSVCLDCHADAGMTMTKNGKEVSISVKKFVLMKSVHKNRNCVDCHKGFDPDAIPHKEKIEPVNCTSCHNNVAQKHLFHPQMVKASGMSGSADVNCKGCHGTHNVESPKSPGSKFYFTKLTEACGNCHEKEKAEHLQSEHYFALANNNPNVPTCMFCHSQPITAGTKLAETQIKVNQEKLCLSCHLNNPNIKSAYSKTLVSYEKSVHGAAILRGRKEAPVCVDCHGVHDLQKASKPGSTISQQNVPKLCGKCHISIGQEFQSSIHGIALKKGNTDAPGCTYCHGEHAIKPVPDIPSKFFQESHINRLTIVRNKMVFCVGCHADEAFSKKYGFSTITKAHDWMPNQVTHYETVRCVDCHSSYAPPNLSHNILPPEKTVKKCEECHTKNSILMSKLYKHEKKQSREKFGFINGTLLSDAYVIGTTRNVILDSLSLIIFGFVLAGVGLHGFLRWYFKREIKK